MKRKREAAGLTQMALASKLGVTIGTVQSWEYGKHVPRMTPDKMKQLCELLGVTLDELAAEFSKN